MPHHLIPRPGPPLAALSSRLVTTLAAFQTALVLALRHAAHRSLSSSALAAQQLVAGWHRHARATQRRLNGARVGGLKRRCSRGAGTSADSRRAPVSANPTVERLVSTGLAAEKKRSVQEAIDAFEAALVHEPESLALLCLAAKQWTDLSLALDQGAWEQRRVANTRAVSLSSRALALAPACPQALVLGSIARGRLAALAEGARAKVELAAQAQAAAGAALAADPANDHAHHLLGRWHYEMARVSPALRVLGRMAYGGALVEGSRDAALAAYQRAAALAPARLIHRVECGRVLLDLGREGEARGHLHAALACEVEDLNAWHSLEDARRMLRQLGAPRAAEGPPAATPPVLA